MNLSWLAQLAPTVATALGGPLAGMAVEAVGKALGVPSDDAKKLLESGKMTSDQITLIKQAEIALQAQAQELGLNFETLATQDRKSARDMQISTKSIIPAVLAIGVTIGFFAILVGLMTDNVTKLNDHRPDAPPDPLEPLRLAQAAAQMGLKHVVVTSDDRDDVADKGARCVSIDVVHLPQVEAAVLRSQHDAA